MTQRPTAPEISDKTPDDTMGTNLAQQPAPQRAYDPITWEEARAFLHDRHMLTNRDVALIKSFVAPGRDSRVPTKQEWDLLMTEKPLYATLADAPLTNLGETLFKSFVAPGRDRPPTKQEWDLLTGISPDTNKPTYMTPKYIAELAAHEARPDWRVPTKAELDVLFNNRSRGKLSRTFNASASNKISAWLSLFGIAGGLLFSSPAVIVLGVLGFGFSVAAAVRHAREEDLRSTKSPTAIGDKMPDGTIYAGVSPDGPLYVSPPRPPDLKR